MPGMKPMTLAEVPRTKLSPAMQQYAAVKDAHPDCIIFFRIGDFYEMFFEDALTVSQELELTLTGKECGLEERAPMCGVPYHSVDIYLKRLLDFGHKIAICEQLTDPAESHGLVERDVVRIVTPGTLIDPDMLSDDTNNFLGCLYCDDMGNAALVFADLSTGQMQLTLPQNDREMTNEIIDTISRYAPSEMLMNPTALFQKEIVRFLKTHCDCAVTSREESCFDVEKSWENICAQFQVSSVEMLGIPAEGVAIAAIGGMFDYIFETQKSTITRFTSIELSDHLSYMGLDQTARRNLELTQTIRGKEKRGSLLALLDHTKTAMGKRLLKIWLEQPLLQPLKIMERLDAVEAFVRDGFTLMEVRDILRGIGDLERLMTRVIYQKATPRDLKLLSAAATQLPDLKESLQHLTASSRFLRALEGNISSLGDIQTIVDQAIQEEPPLSLKDGGVIRDGYSPELDEQRRLAAGGEDILTDILERERERTGIKGLKIGNNHVFGYYLEVTRSYYDLVPDDYIRKQTLANSERFVTEELKNVENRIVRAKEYARRLEEDIFTDVRNRVATMLESVQGTATAIAQVDVLASFADVAVTQNWTKPDISVDGKIQITQGRHPVVEALQTEEMFVPNDTYLDTASQRVMLITGPNMAGKSTYMRQVALITLLAQIGSFVPASYAHISVVDHIFTRIGASDDVSAGQSTFMVEMQEVSDILKHATKNSLVLLDEVGRGTSTFDGISIASASAEYISQKIGCKTLFATHYHELLSLENKLDGVKNFSIAVKKVGGTIRFLRKIVPGGSSDSYGISVAKLAGLPNRVTKRAEEILAELEENAARENQNKNQNQDQISFYDMQRARVISQISRTNPAELTDSECRQLLDELVAILQQ